VSTEARIESFLFRIRHSENIFAAMTFVVVLYTLYYVFMVVPNERIMGAVQRIFYFHVGAAISCYLMIAVLFIGSVCYLTLKKGFWDRLAEAGGEVALLLCTIVLLSGMIWAKSAWNVWWRWEPRLVSFLILWLILIGYNLLRMLLKSEEKLPSFSAVLGIIAAVNVPIVIFSIRLLAPQEQLHPEVVANQGLKDPRFTSALLLGNLSFCLLSLYFLLLRVRQAVLQQRVESA
jgi:heme exporter protein C